MTSVKPATGDRKKKSSNKRSHSISVSTSVTKKLKDVKQLTCMLGKLFIEFIFASIFWNVPNKQSVIIDGHCYPNEFALSYFMIIQLQWKHKKNQCNLSIKLSFSSKHNKNEKHTCFTAFCAPDLFLKVIKA